MAKYKVKSGNTLKQIARRNGISIARLKKLNPGLTKKTLTPGKRIKLGKGVGGRNTSRGGSSTTGPQAKDLAPSPEAKAAARQEKRTVRLMQDPAYAAFMRQMGFDESEIESNLTALKASYDRQIVRQTPIFADQRLKAETAANRSADNRGLFRSGQRLFDVADRQSQVDLTEEQFRTGIQDSKLEASVDRDKKLNTLERMRQEEAVSARDRLTSEDAQTKYGF